MDRVEVDESCWPLVVVRYHGTPSDAEFEVYLGKIKANLDRAVRDRKKTALVFDATLSSGPTARQRTRQAEWVKEHELPSRLHSAGYAFVIPSALIRGMLTAILWLSPMPAPYVIVSTVDEADAWCRQKLREANGEEPKSWLAAR